MPFGGSQTPLHPHLPKPILCLEKLVQERRGLLWKSSLGPEPNQRFPWILLHPCGSGCILLQIRRALALPQHLSQPG